MTAFIYGILAGLGQEGILWGVALLLAVLFVLGLLSEKFRQAAPALMTSLGILGTFCGIFIALYPLDFSPDRINNSIEELLDGMTTAFVTSLLGIASAIVFRVASIPFSISLWGILSRLIQGKSVVPPEQREILNRLDNIHRAIAGNDDSSIAKQMKKMRDENLKGIHDAIAGDNDSSIAKQMKELRKENKTGFEKLEELSETTRDTLAKRLETLAGEAREIIGQQRENLDRLENIRKAIAGDGDSSMVAQMQELRAENIEGFKKLEGLSEIIRTELIKSLKKLIGEIRKIIGEQLGESLKQLIASIQKALIDQFGKTFVEFNEATQALKKWQEDHRAQVEQLTDAFNLAVKGIAQIAEECEKIPQTMGQLRDVVKTAHDEVESLKSLLESFAALEEQAKNAFPTIKQNLDKIGEDLETSAQGFNQLEETIKAAESKTREIAQQHAKNVEEIAAGMRETLEKAQNDSAQKVTKVVEGAINQFSQEMNREIDRVARAWGGNLVSIAEKAQQAIDAAERKRQ